MRGTKEVPVPDSVNNKHRRGSAHPATRKSTHTPTSKGTEASPKTPRAELSTGMTMSEWEDALASWRAVPMKLIAVNSDQSQFLSLKLVPVNAPATKAED
jgi:hypothetical protein